MKNPGSALPVLLILGLLFLLAFLFPAFVQDNLITPVALVLWLLWRVVQSVDQALYWILLVLLVLGYILARLYNAAQRATDVEQPASPDSNAVREQISYWRLSILWGSSADRSAMTKHNLGMMLAALYASKEPETVQFEIYDGMKRQEIPLPEPVYTFLFLPWSSDSPRSWKRILASIPVLYRAQVRRWTGRETAEYYQSLDQVLAYMESLMENGHDDGYFNSSDH